MFRLAVIVVISLVISLASTLPVNDNAADDEEPLAVAAAPANAEGPPFFRFGVITEKSADNAADDDYERPLVATAPADIEGVTSPFRFGVITEKSNGNADDDDYEKPLVATGPSYGGIPLNLDPNDPALVTDLDKFYQNNDADNDEQLEEAAAE